MYLAESQDRDIVIAREIVRRKVEGQREALLAHPHLPEATGAERVCRTPFLANVDHPARMAHEYQYAACL